MRENIERKKKWTDRKGMMQVDTCTSTKVERDRQIKGNKAIVTIVAKK